jgi:hypothetical protein
MVKPIEYLAHFEMALEGDAVHLLFPIDCDEKDVVGGV